MGERLGLNRTLLFALLAAVLAAAMVLAACGGGDDDDASGGADEPAATEDRNEGDGEDEEEPTSEEEGDDDEPTPRDEDEGDDDDGGDGDGGGLDVCALITPDEIEEITGLVVDDGENTSFDPFLSCNYSTETFDSVQVDVYHASEDEVESYFELTEDAEPVQGIGDRAQFGGFLEQLEVLDGGYDVTILVDVTGLDEEQKLDMSLAIAELVLDRLP